MVAGRYHDAHISTKGPGDARPTAIQIVEDEGLVGKKTGKICLITGASQGIGLETARALHVAGFTLYLGVRDLKRAEAAVKSIQSDSTESPPIHLLELSLDSLESVRAAAKHFLNESDQLHLLINNAGVMATPEGITKDGFETQFGTNHLGHFLLFQLLKPAMLASASAGSACRVVCVSSGGHRRGGVRFHDIGFSSEPYDRWTAYGQSKTANIYMANEIDRRYGSRGLHAWSLHPGGIMTNLQQHIESETAKQMFDNDAARSTMKSPAQGAATSVYAAIAKELEGRGGRYLANCEEVDVFSGRPFDDGHAAWAFDEESEKRLWTESCAMVGISEQD